MKEKYFQYFFDLIDYSKPDINDITPLITAYAFLLGRLETFAHFVDCQDYSISKEKIAILLGFDLTETEEKK